MTNIQNPDKNTIMHLSQYSQLHPKSKLARGTAPEEFIVQGKKKNKKQKLILGILKKNFCMHFYLVPTQTNNFSIFFSDCFCLWG